jgi:hypothetical protein
MELKESIILAREKSAVNHRHFLPDTSLTNLITETAVKSILQSTSLLEYIISNSRKVFAVLVFIGMVDEDVIQVFKKHNFNDGHLQIGYDYAKKAVKCINEKSNYTVLGGFRECSRWNTVTTSAFCDAQWQFLAPVFAVEPKRIEYPIYNETPLPFVWRSEKPTGKGTFGLVYQARIHRAHLRLITREACPSTIPCLSFWLISFRRTHIRKSFHQRQGSLNYCG